MYVQMQLLFSCACDVIVVDTMSNVNARQTRGLLNDTRDVVTRCRQREWTLIFLFSSQQNVLYVMMR